MSNNSATAPTLLGGQSQTKKVRACDGKYIRVRRSIRTGIILYANTQPDETRWNGWGNQLGLISGDSQDSIRDVASGDSDGRERRDEVADGNHYANEWCEEEGEREKVIKYVEGERVFGILTCTLTLYIYARRN